MARSSIWDGFEWVSMTGGAGEGESSPDDTYLRIDAGNNPLSPNNFLRTTEADLLYFPLDGGDLFGDLNLIDDTPSLFFLSPNESIGYRIFGNLSDINDLGLSFRNLANIELFVIDGPNGISTFKTQLELVGGQGLADRRIRNVTVSDSTPAGQLGDIWFDTSP